MKKPIPKSSCRFCWHFHNSHITSKDLPVERWCSAGRLTITKDSERCKEWKMTWSFHCQIHQQFVAPDACAHRQIEKQDGCVRCKVGPIVRELRKEQSFIKRQNGDAPVLVRRKKSEPFVPLIRRRSHE